MAKNHFNINDTYIYDNLNTGEYAFIAYDNYNNSWFIRKTYNDIIQYYYLINENDHLFNLFIKGYNRKYNI